MQAQYSINIYFIGIFIVFGVAFLVFSIIYEKSTGYPSPMSLLSENNNAAKFANIFWLIVTLELALGNSLCVYIILKEIPEKTFEPIVVTSFDLSLIIFTLILLFRTKIARKKIDKIVELERDIVFHGLDDSEIRARIQDEIIGNEIGDWLKERIIDVREKAIALGEHADKAKTFCEEYNGLDSNLKHERKGRLEEYLTNLESTQEQYFEESTKLFKWLSIVNSGIKIRIGRRIARVIADTTSELKEISEDVGKKVRLALINLRKL